MSYNPNKDKEEEDKITFRTSKSVIRELKHFAADNDITLTEIINRALRQYIYSKKVTTFEGDKLRNYVATLVILVMRKLREKTHNDETVNIKMHSLYEETCTNAGSPVGIGAYNPKDSELENRVFQELFGREYIKHGNSADEITITYLGKSAAG